MRKKINPAIPEWIVREEDRKIFSQKFHSALSSCINSYKELMNMKDLKLSRNPKVLCVDDVNKYVDERISDVASTKMLTFDSMERAKNEWENIRTNAIVHIQKVQQFFEDYPDAELYVVDESLVCTNFEVLVFGRCKTETPKNVYRHYELIKKVEVAIKALQDFERKEEYPTGDLVNVEMDLRMSKEPQQLIENWLWQKERKAILKKRSDFDAAMEMQERKDKAIRLAKMKERSEKFESEKSRCTLMYNRKHRPDGNEAG